MPICRDCILDFDWLEDEDQVCNKFHELHGRSEIEKVPIHEQPQCMSCSVMFFQLRDPLCNSCCKKLGLPRAQNQSLQKTPAGIANTAQRLVKMKALERAIPGISKSITRVQEAKDMREQGKKIRLVVTFGISEGTKKPVLVSSMRLVHNAAEDLPIFHVIGTIISRVQDAYAKERPEAAAIFRAWRKPAAKSQFARNPPTFIEYKFRRYEVKVEGTNVKLSMRQDAPVETIIVSSDWKAGLDIIDNATSRTGKTPQNIAEDVHKTDFVGRGSSKNVVYARIGNKEYVLGQSQDVALTASENARMVGEMTNLQLGDGIRRIFSVRVDCDVNVPDFRFNVEGIGARPHLGVPWSSFR
ncbi:hypothetical protein C8J57DRAFT_1579029 [Mycena rebaudengoi]|nr:hypothetical protein C8J57DRAFT_1579029 [Mycena rebaudengoi]